jgi:hypothetical protein
MKTDAVFKSELHPTENLDSHEVSQGNPAMTKLCSTCDQTKPLKEFYRKGSRTDSACKACQKKKKQTKYVAGKGKDVVAGLMSIIGITTQGLSNRIRSEIRKMDEVILCLKSKR